MIFKGIILLTQLFFVHLYSACQKMLIWPNKQKYIYIYFFWGGGGFCRTHGTCFFNSVKIMPKYGDVLEAVGHLPSHRLAAC